MAEAQNPEGAVAAHRNKKTMTGVVTSNRMQKTITVEVRRLFKHAQYGKYLYRSTHLHAHDEKNEARQGDKVEVVPSRPLSKQKRYRLLRIVERAADSGPLELKDVEVANRTMKP